MTTETSVDPDHAKISAIIHSLYKFGKRDNLLSKQIETINKPFGYTSGDFYWARRIDDSATIVVGDASGHNAYAATLRLMISFLFESMLRRKKDSRRRLMSARHILVDLAKSFREYMDEAASVVVEKGDGSPDYDRIAERMRLEGFDAVSCVVGRSTFRICNAGLPAFLIYKDGTVSRVGAFNSGKQITAEQGAAKRISTTIRPVWPLAIRYAVLVSDGIPDQKDPAGAEFGEAAICERLRHLGQRLKEVDAKAIARALIEASDAHRQDAPVGDDRIVVVVDVAAIRDSLTPRSS